MAYSNGRISGYPSIYDLRQCFATNKTDLGDIITNMSINKWARYKPVRDGNYKQLDLSNRINVKFGLDPGVSAGGDTGWYLYDKLFAFIYGGGQPWSYLKPRGSSNGEYYRLTDFVKDTDTTSMGVLPSISGYNHNAVFPFCGVIYNGTFTSSSTVEINAVAENVATLKCMDNTAGEIRLREFLKFDTISDTDNPWRAVFELIDNSDGNWQQRGAPTLRVVGGAVSLDQNFNATVDVPLNDPAIIAAQVNPVNDGTVKKFVAILGLQRCNAADTTHRAGGFVMPLGRVDSEELVYINTTFFNLNIVKYYAIYATITKVGYGTSGSFTGSGSSWSTSNNFNGQSLWVHMKVTSHVNQLMRFAYKTTSVSGMKIEIACQLQSDSTSTDNFVVYPSNESRKQNSSGNVQIPARTTDMDLYWVSTNYFPTGSQTSYSFQLFMRTKTDNNYSDWVSFGAFGVYKT